MNGNNGAPEGGKNTRVYFYTGLAALILSAAAMGLTFTALGVYSLIAAILLALASLSFFEAQRKKNAFAALKAVKIIAYIALAVYAAFFIGGMIYAAIG